MLLLKWLMLPNHKELSYSSIENIFRKRRKHEKEENALTSVQNFPANKIEKRQNNWVNRATAEVSNVV